MLTDTLLDTIRETLRNTTGQEYTIEGSSPVGGGSINDAYRLRTDREDLFIKVNHADRYPGMFEAEAKGLELLRQADEIFIPKVITHGRAGEEAFIVLEFVGNSTQQPDFWTRFGSELARLHRHSNDTFGLNHDNYIGSLPQPNNAHEDWPSFFARERLEFQAKMARDDGKISSELVRKFERLYERLGDIFPEEPPALLHGDLWSGNYMQGPEGGPCIMDPAVYYGHREMDLGMTRMFGGFDPEFYRSYNETYPLEPGWEERLEICNLYPLMVHVNLFGGGYRSEVEAILRRY